MRKIYYFALIILFLMFAANIVLAQESGEFSESKLEIVSPKEGELITGDEILLKIQFPGEGGNHAHIWLDEPNPTADNLKSLEAPGPFLFRDVKPGDHTIIVELAGEDHKPVDPAQKITLKVKNRGAADVTQEEIAKALAQVKPAEKEQVNVNITTEVSTKGCIVGPLSSDCVSQSEAAFQNILILIISGIIVIAIVIGAAFLLQRSKKQQ